MKWLRLVRGELRKLTTTSMPWAFVAVLVVVAAVNAAAIVLGTDADGSKGFIATAEDQLSLLAFGANAMVITGFFGAIAVSREYGHGTVVPTFLTTPRRVRAVLAQLTAVFVGGGALGLVGAGLIIVTGAISIPAVDHEFVLSLGTITRVLAAATLAGGLGAVLGAGVGALVRNTGGAVVGAVLLLVILPPLAPQLVSQAASWIPGTLVNVISGVGDDPGLAGALLALAAWSLVPAAIGLAAVQKRDVV